MSRDTHPQHANKPRGASTAPAELPGAAALWHPAQLLGGMFHFQAYILPPAAQKGAELHDEMISWSYD